MTTGPGLDFYYPTCLFSCFMFNPIPHGLDGFIFQPTPILAFALSHSTALHMIRQTRPGYPWSIDRKSLPLNLPLSHLPPPLPLLPFSFSASAISGHIPSTTISRFIPLILLYEYIFWWGMKKHETSSIRLVIGRVSELYLFTIFPFWFFSFYIHPIYKEGHGRGGQKYVRT